MIGTKGMRVSIAMVLFILFVVVYMELRQTILMPDRVSVQNFIGKVNPHGLPFKLNDYKPPAFAEKDSFADVVRMYANKNNMLSISVISKNYVDMALNFLKSSAWHLVNNGRSFLLITTDEEAHKILLGKGIHNFYYNDTPTIAFKNQIGMSKGHDYGSKNYFIHSNTKTWVTMKILELGYSVLMCDTDVVVFKDPFPYFNCADCDIHTQKDRYQFNTGFTFIKPTNLSKLLYKTAWDLYVQYHKSHDQIYISMALQGLSNQNITTPEIQYLSPKQFMCGVNYYEYGNRMFVNEPCTECVMVHNNYMGSLSGKIYRFKENLQWHLDEGEYYSSKSRRYLSYGNPYYFGDRTVELERGALLTALKIARATNRTLILPKFHCCDCEREKCEDLIVRCSLLSVLSLKTFDSVYGGQYREHTFLRNYLIPQDVQLHKAKNLAVLTKVVKEKESNLTESRIYTIVSFSDKMADFSSLVKWVASFNDRIVYFHSLYDVVPIDEKKEKNGFECAPYQQWDPNFKV